MLQMRMPEVSIGTQTGDDAAEMSQQEAQPEVEGGCGYKWELNYFTGVVCVLVCACVSAHVCWWTCVWVGVKGERSP